MTLNFARAMAGQATWATYARTEVDAALRLIASELDRVEAEYAWMNEQHPCRWTEDEDGNWETACGQMFCFIEGGPQDNRMVFCCYCGKPLASEAKAALEGDHVRR